MAALSLRAAGIDVVLLDIEGTTTPIAFVHDVLFPYARARVQAYLSASAPGDRDLIAVLDGLREEHARDLARGETPPPLASSSHEASIASFTAYIHWLMDRDRKSGPLKALQGRIWESGYADGSLKGDVYADTRDAFVQWTGGGLRLAIYSSGSILAQKLLFANSTAGDLSPFLSGYFDTGVGAKTETASYARIADALAVPPGALLFISDMVMELDAARAAGLRTLLSVRPPAVPPADSSYDIVQRLDVIQP